MADRKHEDFPIKFGPMWLRNLSREGSTGSTAVNSGGGGGATRTPTAASASGAPAQQQTKYKLADYRYGREEILALYDKNSSPPFELKELETLFVPQAQRPLALTTDILEDEMRESVPGLSSSAVGGGAAGIGTAPSDRLGTIRGATGPIGRGRGRPHALSNAVPGRPVSAFNPTSAGEDSSFGDMPGPGRSRSWMANYAANHLGNRNGTENPDWLANSNRPYKRWPDNSNWRRSTSTQEAEGGWRGGTDAAARPRPQHSTQEKWDRERGEQGGREKPTSWIPTRRAWSGDSTEDHLPEWAIDSNQEPGAGTFDSSGAFHGTIDDSSIPPRTTSEHFHGLSRSHTQGSITSRARHIDDMSDSNKVIPKQFDATEIKFKKSPASDNKEGADIFKSNEGGMAQSWFAKALKKDKNKPSKEVPALAEAPTTASKPILQDTQQENYLTGKSEVKNAPHAREVSAKRFEAMRSEIKMEEANDERGNFNSVLITTNNSLRQKHQNIVTQPLSAASVQQASAKDAESESEPVKDISDPVNNMLKGLSLEEEMARGARSKVRWSAPLVQMIAPVPLDVSSIPLPPATVASNDAPSIPAYSADTLSSLSITPEDLQNIWTAMQNSIGKRALDEIDDSRRNKLIETFADTWYYEDPQQVLRGPFKGSEMCQWFLSGYFTSTLKVRRMFDTQMRPLGDFGTLPSFVLNNLNLTSTKIQKEVGMNQKLQQDQLLHKQQQEQLLHKQQQDHLLHKQQQDQLLHKQQQDQLLHKLQQEQQHHEQLIQKQQEQLLQEQLLKSQQLQQYQQQLQLQQQLQQQQLPPDLLDEYPMRARQASGIDQNPVLGMQPNFAVDPMMNIPNTSHPAMPFNMPSNFVMNLPMMPQQQTESLWGQQSPNYTWMQPPLVKQPETKMASVWDIEEPMESTRREPNASGVGVTSKQQASLAKTQVEQKQTKAASGDSEKTSKNKENAAAKSKSKNSKLKERNEESGDRKSTEEDGSSVKEKSEISPKNKKEEKLSKRELEKEKQELIKEGFTMVKGPERTKKETRKNEDAKAEDEVEKKRKHAEFMKKQDDFIRKLEQEMEEEKKLEIKYQQQLELEMEKIKKKMKTSSSSKKAPWSAVSGTAAQPSGAADPPTLAEIQRLEREKKFEVIKEQQQMVQLIAQQQQAALAREQELQQTTGYNWTKYKSKKNFENIKSLTEIQEESRQAEMRLRQAQPKPTEEPAPQLPAAAQNHAPWSQNGGSTNLGGFWEAMPGAAGKPEAPRPSKPSSNAPQQQPSNKPLNKKSIKAAKEAPKELPSSKEFETWCNSVLSPWSKKIDVPVFVGFLKDIESPFEVKDYVKCYLGESKDSSDFAKSFLEKRSKLLRVAQATPVDDLCSPAPAKNPPPQTISSDFYELKGKARKVKKNKMLKVDARILGFSVTAAEDRINVGDIDSI